VQCRLLLDVVIRKSSPVLELLASEDKALLVRRDALLILDLRLNVVNGVRRLNFECDRLSCQRLDENLHTTTKSKDEMEGRLFLDVVVRKGATILKLLPSEDQPLLVRWDTLLVLNLGLHIVNRVRRFDFQRDGLAGEGLHENLHAATQTKDEMKSRLLLNVIVGEGAAILELFAGEDKTLLVGRDTLFVLDLGLDIVNGIGGLDLEGDRLSSESLYEDLHVVDVRGWLRYEGKIRRRVS